MRALAQRLRLPGGGERQVVLAAGVVWLAALAGLVAGWWALAIPVVALFVVRRRSAGVLVLVAVAGVGAGSLAAAREAATVKAWLPDGQAEITAQVVVDPTQGRFGDRVVVRPTSLIVGGERTSWDGPVLVVRVPDQIDAVVGHVISARGRIRRSPGRIRGLVVAGEMQAIEVTVLERSANPMLIVGNAFRARVQDALATDEAGRGHALLRGLLIGDVTAMSEGDLDDLRAVGLTHFVAVSGGNVALFLAGWWLALAPLGISPRMRALAGLVGVVIFVVATRWEPSVVRAGAMAVIVLAGRIVGIPVGAWSALGLAVTGLLLLSADLAGDLGFQLSALAAAGVIAGAGIFAGRRPGALWTALAATLSAQTAVLPLLLLTFGGVPLVAPLANVAAAPLVVVATSLGGVGVATGLEPVTDLAVTVAEIILRLARALAVWPLLSPAAVVAVGAGVAAMAVRVLRPLAVVVFGFVIVAAAPAKEAWPSIPMATFLDVGQGDATLLRSPGGSAVLIDGGADPWQLQRLLAQRGVARLDLVVATHGDADHAAGLVGLGDTVGYDRLWLPKHAVLVGPFADLVAEAIQREVPVTEVGLGTVIQLDGIQVTTLGPRRRYAAENDGSVVLLVESASRSLLIAGDIEANAQRELPQLRPDILLVPHHGSATTDIEWLRQTSGSTAIVSVGPNRFGHPRSEILDTLAALGTRVWITQRDGTIDIPLVDPLNRRVAAQVYSRVREVHRDHHRAPGGGTRRARADARPRSSGDGAARDHRSRPCPRSRPRQRR